MGFRVSVIWSDKGGRETDEARHVSTYIKAAPCQTEYGNNDKVGALAKRYHPRALFVEISGAVEGKRGQSISCGDA